MASKFAIGKYTIAECDICGFRYKLSTFREIFANDKPTGILACKECWNAEHPQNDLGKYPVVDAEAIRNPRPDTSYPQSRNFQWGWNPVGISNPLTPNDLIGHGSVGAVTVVVTE